MIALNAVKSKPTRFEVFEIFEVKFREAWDRLLPEMEFTDIIQIYRNALKGPNIFDIHYQTGLEIMMMKNTKIIDQLANATHPKDFMLGLHYLEGSLYLMSSSNLRAAKLHTEIIDQFIKHDTNLSQENFSRMMKAFVAN